MIWVPNQPKRTTKDTQEPSMPHNKLYMQVMTPIRDITLYLAVGAAIGIISNATGCTAIVATQLDQDIATSATEPLAAFKAANAHANKFIADNRTDIPRYTNP